jgi:membrane protein
MEAMRSSIRRLKQKLKAWWQSLSPYHRALPKYLWRAVLNYLQSGSRQAAALAYYAIFSVFPLVLLLAVAIGNIVGPAVAQEQIANGLSIFLPESTIVDIQGILGNALEQSSSFGLVALVGLTWAATGLFSNITMAIDAIFEAPNLRSLWRQRLLAIIMGFVLVALVLMSFLTSGVLRLFSVFLLDRPSVWVSIGTFFLPLGLDVVIFALLFRYVPTRFVSWDAVWPAALLGATGWELAKNLFEWYLGNIAEYSIIYGGIATGIVLLFWAYLIASIFLFSAQVCARLNEWLVEREEREALMREQTRLKQYMQQNPAWQLPILQQATSESDMLAVPMPPSAYDSLYESAEQF